MTLSHILYADNYTRKIADEIAKDHKITPQLFRIYNPTFHRWSLWIQKKRRKTNTRRNQLPPSSMLIGGNRWRHHFALELTDFPIVSIDAHTDMNYDEMIPLRFVRPYNWLYFKLLEGYETHLVLPYSNFRGGRWNIILPEKYADRFYLYSFDKKKSSAEVSISFNRSTTVEIRDLETHPPILDVNKQISLDWDITREVQEGRVERLLTRIVREGDICDIWLDEGKRGRRNTMKDHIRYCSTVFEVLNSS